MDITRNTESRLREFAPDAEIEFTRVAVTERQIYSLDLPTRPTKKTDSRAKGFDGESVEVDAIPARELRRMCREVIEYFIDHDALAALRLVEEQERATLDGILQNLAVHS